MANVRGRIPLFLASQEITTKDFLDRTGLKKGYTDISTINSEVKESVLSKILESYPDINLEWLLTGKGEMLKSEAVPIGECARCAELEKELKSAKDRIIELQEQLIESLGGKKGIG